MPKRKNMSASQVAKAQGFKSGLEGAVSQQIKEVTGRKARYEDMKIEWEDLAYRSYTPDFILPNQIIIETKGRFTPVDRRKHKEIKKQYPDLDIRFVFTNSNSKISKGSKTSYGMWCEKNSFLYADKYIPDEWFEEPVQEEVPKRVVFKDKVKR